MKVQYSSKRSVPLIRVSLVFLQRVSVGLWPRAGYERAWMTSLDVLRIIADLPFIRKWQDTPTFLRLGVQFHLKYMHDLISNFEMLCFPLCCKPYRDCMRRKRGIYSHLHHPCRHSPRISLSTETGWCSHILPYINRHVCRWIASTYLKTSCEAST